MSEASFPFVQPDEAALQARLARAVQGCARRDPDALRELHDAAAPALLGELLQLLGDPDDAEGALAEGLGRAWREAARFPASGTPALLWLRALARATAIDTLRVRDARSAPDDVTAQLRFLETAFAGESPQSRATAPDLRSLPPGLGEADRRLLTLAWCAGRPAPQLAAALGLDAASLRRALAQGLAAFAVSVDTEAAASDPVTERLLAGYVLGLQSDPVRRRLAARLDREPLLRRRWLAWESRLAALAPRVPVARPSDGLWKVLRRVADTDRVTPTRRAGWKRWLLPLAVVIALALAALWLMSPPRAG